MPLSHLSDHSCPILEKFPLKTVKVERCLEVFKRPICTRLYLLVESESGKIVLGNFQLSGGVKKKAAPTQKTSRCSFRGRRLVNFQNISSSPCYRRTSDFIIGTFSFKHAVSTKEKAFTAPATWIMHCSAINLKYQKVKFTEVCRIIGGTNV